ncbi:MAG TPA: IS701 family transposase, partial [Chloroflexota bacterium]|nr:IS701 family transposase [Chloroflexota bacterium]
MDQAAFDRVAVSFAAFHAEFAPLFGRTEAQRRSEQYLRGLLVQHTERRNAENVAEAIEGATPRALQRLLTEAPWPTAPVIDRVQRYVGSRVSSAEGVFIIDESGVAKQGRQSVGVAPQYCGALGKVGNCQLGVFLAYASPRGHALVDERLFLPEEWTNDPARCQAAGVPAEVGYQSKAQLGLAMLRQARATGHLAGNWVAGDDAYGMVPTLRDALDSEGWRYVLDVPATTPVFTQWPHLVVPPWSGRGRKPTVPRRAPTGPQPQPVAAGAAALPATAWQNL